MDASAAYIWAVGVRVDLAERLDGRTVALWRRYGYVALGVAVLCVVAVAVSLSLAGEPIGAVVALGSLASGAIAVLAVSLPQRRYRHWAYELGPDALEMQHGAFIRRRSVIPYFRVQHVDMSRGPFERSLGLARLTVHTASSGTDATIPGLDEGVAAELRAAIVSRAGRSAGV